MEVLDFFQNGNYQLNKDNFLNQYEHEDSKKFFRKL